jgi:hypothetical protein
VNILLLFLCSETKRPLLPRQARDKHTKSGETSSPISGLLKAGLGHVLTIGTDDCCGGEYRVVPQMAADPELNASIDILGAHCTGEKTGFFRHLYIKVRYIYMRSFYQDRLGTNIGKALKKEDPFWKAHKTARRTRRKVRTLFLRCHFTANCIIIDHFSALEPGLVAPFLCGA